MVRINLLPHREARRRQRKAAFFAMVGACVLTGALAVLMAGAVIGTRIDQQTARNNMIKAENARLDAQIKEIANLKQEIEALKARKQAVEDLQSDRNQPVYLMDELVRQVPEGIYLRSFKQNGQRVVLHGYAHTNERVSELLRNLSNGSAWLERPELVEIRATAQGSGKDVRKVFDFTVNVGIKRQREQDAAQAASAAPARGGPGKS
ncbi:MAG: PilN domain-containing protein [Noviherbaspirillum sp.]